MFKRFRQLEISLAAKCQLLFGLAVTLIIAAALMFPWQRIEQLTEQVNEVYASAYASAAERMHVEMQLALKAAGHPATRPAGSATSQPAKVIAQAVTTAPTSLSAPTGPNQVEVRMILVNDSGPMNRFQARAVGRFVEDPDREPYRKTEEQQVSYRYARALFAQDRCLACHAADVPANSADSKRAPLLGVVTVEIPAQVDFTQVFLNRMFIFLGGLLAGTLAIAVFYLITTRLILGPVRVLRETAEKVSKGDLNIRSDISTGDEFQHLSEAFNKMLSNLQETEDQLRAINKSLDLKLEQLAESNLALYESNRLKSEFLANVSHELRTPLNSILGFAELLKDSVPADAKNTRYVQNIMASGKNLLDLINDLLDLAKIEAGRMEVRSEPLSLPDLFEGLVGIIKPLCEKKDAAVATSVARDVPVIHTDPAKLQQILYNFLSNAIKFSPQSGRIELRAERRDENHVRIAVSDQGPGIAPEKHSEIFEKFRQIDGSVTRQHSGTGLGLSISKELTTLLGGQIGVQSDIAQGATFYIVLPLKIQPGTQPLPALQVAEAPQ